MKIAFFSENGFNGKVDRTHDNMRVEFAWMCALQADHYNVHQLNILEQYDLGIVIIPKTNSQFDIERIKSYCKQVASMQEGPHWYFQDYPLDQQIWFYNILMEMDMLFVHNEIDKKYYEGLTDKKCYVNPTLMLEDQIKPHILNPDARSGVIIGGNMVRWYGGFDSYIIAQEFGEDIFAPSMGRKIDREDEMEITHLPYMNWINWMNNLSRFKYAVHLMPTFAAGTFALNCAYHGIPCIGYKGLDTQSKCHPQLTVKMNDLDGARKLANQLKNDNGFYETQSETAKRNFFAFFGEKEYIYTMRRIIKEVITCENTK